MYVLISFINIVFRFFLLLIKLGDKEILRSKLSAMEDTVKSLREELVAKQENSEVLQKQLKQNEELQKKVIIFLTNFLYLCLLN